MPNRNHPFNSQWVNSRPPKTGTVPYAKRTGSPRNAAQTPHPFITAHNLPPGLKAKKSRGR